MLLRQALKAARRIRAYKVIHSSGGKFDQDQDNHSPHARRLFLVLVIGAMVAATSFAQNAASAIAQESQSDATPVTQAGTSGEGKASATKSQAEKPAATQSGSTDKAAVAKPTAKKSDAAKSDTTNKSDSPATKASPKTASPKSDSKSDSKADGKTKANGKQSTAKVDDRIHLISDKFPHGWKYFSAESGSKCSEVWRVQKDANTDKTILICKGMPEGYLRTETEFDDYEMELEWMFPADENGNSGVLLHMAPKDKMWPDSIQLQLHRPTAGSVFPSGDGKSASTLEKRDLSAELCKWNKCKIISRAGKLTIEINGKKVGDVDGCMPARGRIALQSEGSEIHFRNMWIRKLKPVRVVTPKPETVEAETVKQTNAG